MGQGRDRTQILVCALLTTPYCLGGETPPVEALSCRWHNGYERLRPWVGAGGWQVTVAFFLSGGPRGWWSQAWALAGGLGPNPRWATHDPCDQASRLTSFIFKLSILRDLDVPKSCQESSRIPFI